MAVIRLLAGFCVALYFCKAELFQQALWREVFTVDVVAPGAALNASAPSKAVCVLYCLQLEGCKTSAFHQDSATCWLYRHLVEYTTTGVASPGTRYFWRVSPGCPGELGYQLEAGICLKVYSTRMNRTTAEEICRNDSGHLAIADTAEKKNAIHLNVNDTTWLGGSDEENEGGLRCWIIHYGNKKIEI